MIFGGKPAEAVTRTGTDIGQTIRGGHFNDHMFGLGGDDILKGYGGQDELDGGAGSDTADYSDKSAAVAVTLNGATDAIVTVGGVAEDTIHNIEYLVGGSGNDTLTGDALVNNFAGNAGNDLLKGGGGNDVLDGGADIDTADYSDKTAAVVTTLNGGATVAVTVGG